MSKVEIAGPRDLLLPALETIEQLGVLQIDASLREPAHEGAAHGIRPLAWDGRTLAERLFLEDLKIKVERLLELLPEAEARESYLSPSRAISSVAALVAKHLEAAEAQPAGGMRCRPNSPASTAISCSCPRWSRSRRTRPSGPGSNTSASRCAIRRRWSN